jgi:hypothetical protein
MAGVVHLEGVVERHPVRRVGPRHKAIGDEQLQAGVGTIEDGRLLARGQGGGGKDLEAGSTGGGALHRGDEASHAGCTERKAG